MDAVLDDPRVEDAVIASQDAALARLRARDFPAILLRDVAGLLAAGPRGAPQVAWDFWAQFDQFERLEELRQFRPAVFRALPAAPSAPETGPGTGTRDSAFRSHQRGHRRPDSLPTRQVQSARIPDPDPDPGKIRRDHQPMGPGSPQR